MAIDAGYFPGPRMFVTVSALSQTGGHTDAHFMCGADLDIPLPDRPAWTVDGVEPMRKRVRELIRAGADIDAYSHNKFHSCPLQSAAAATQLEAARVLLTKGANPNCRGDGGYSPLHEAAGSGQLELARLLLQHQADISAKGDDGKTPLDVAVEAKQSAILGLLKKEAK